MATTRILDHLENIKVFSDFKRSQISSFNEFWNRIENGQTVFGLDYKSRKRPTINPRDLTYEEIDELIERRQAFRTDEQYITKIRDGIEKIIQWDERPILNLFELTDLEEIIFGNDSLKEYLNVSKDLLQDYIQSVSLQNPEGFFEGLVNHSKSIEVIEQPLHEDIGLKSPEYPVYFENGGYRLFQKLAESMSGSASDYAFIFGMLKEDKFIHNHISESMFREFLENQGVEFKRLKPLRNVSTPNRLSLYKQIRKSIDG